MITVFFYAGTGKVYVGQYDWPENFPIPLVDETVLFTERDFLVNAKVLNPNGQYIELYTITDEKVFK